MATVFIEGFDSENRVGGFHSEDTAAAAGEPEQGRLSDADIDALAALYAKAGYAQSRVLRLIEEVRARRNLDAQYQRAFEALKGMLVAVESHLHHPSPGSEALYRLREARDAANELAVRIDHSKVANDCSASNSRSAVEEGEPACEEMQQVMRPAAIWEGRRRRRLELL